MYADDTKMILRKGGVATSQSMTTTTTSQSLHTSIKPTSASSSSSSFTVKAGTLFFVALILFFLVITRLSANKLTANPAPVPSESQSEKVLRTQAPVSLDNCALINQLLSGEIPSTKDGLPSAGKPTNFGAVFWLKSPILRAKIHNDQDVVLLKYNKYLPKQHTLKWANTVSILNEHRDGKVFPKMNAYCKDPGDGFHYILVEWIDLHPSELPAPRDFPQCFERLDKVMNLLITLDEEMHLAFMDVKKGQWMSRAGGNSFVLQDVDDIVRSPWVPSKEAGDLYNDQVGFAQSIIQSDLPPGTAIGAVKKVWDEEFFPSGYTIRYAMILLGEIVQRDMGFRWQSDCSAGMPPGFLKCFDKVVIWARTVSNEWPAPRQVLWAFNECRLKGTFDMSEPQARRAIQPWRESPPNDSRKTYISCIRESDSVSKTDKHYTENLSFCELADNGQAVRWSGNNTSKTCCRAKGSNPCYYYVAKQTMCQ
jgi:hypothetical protein